MTKGMWWAIGIVGTIVGVIHVACAGQYGLFRNELYFIVCGWHPAFGYVDQPPMVPLLSALLWTTKSIWMVRLPSVLTAILLVPLTVVFAQLVGATTRGAWMAAVAAGSAALVTAMTSNFGTSTFEQIDFTLVAYLVTRAMVRAEPRAYWWAGIVAGLAFETKFSIVMWAIGLAIGLLATGPRSVFRSRDLWIGVVIAGVIAMPAALWQALHGFPFLELVRNDNSGNLTGGPIAFTLQQVFLVNFLLAPLWLMGVIGPFVMKRLAPFRYLAVTFVVVGALIVITHGKAYYFAGAYPTAFALGAAACTMLPRVLIAFWAVLSTANGALALPFVLPVLPPERLKFMLDHGAFKPRPMERAGIGAPITQLFSDQFGWPQLAKTVEDTVLRCPQLIEQTSLSTLKTTATPAR